LQKCSVLHALASKAIPGNRASPGDFATVPRDPSLKFRKTVDVDFACGANANVFTKYLALEVPHDRDRPRLDGNRGPLQVIDAGGRQRWGKHFAFTSAVWTNIFHATFIAPGFVGGIAVLPSIGAENAIETSLTNASRGCGNGSFASARKPSATAAVMISTICKNEKGEVSVDYIAGPRSPNGSNLITLIHLQEPSPSPSDSDNGYIDAGKKLH
jgi:hypothetical protein